ncbi:hypothetical protein PG999_005732 [Apiospora kogelbergensis]|uniref:Uncharacterized protein n=1 Tax=Apiospora kogelbergensis TaxID=1337665 RepID=A0AAW0QVQ9_9PEZI
MGSISFNPTAVPARGADDASSSISGSSSSGLSHDVQVDIGVGVGVGGALLVHSLRRQKKTAQPPQYETPKQQWVRSHEASPDPEDVGGSGRAQQISPKPASNQKGTKSPKLGAGFWDIPKLSGGPTLRSELPSRGATKKEHLAELPGAA